MSQHSEQVAKNELAYLEKCFQEYDADTREDKDTVLFEQFKDEVLTVDTFTVKHIVLAFGSPNVRVMGKWDNEANLVEVQLQYADGGETFQNVPLTNKFEEFLRRYIDFLGVGNDYA